MTALIRKYSALLAAGVILLALIAAPYLNTENPDSAVFRSGSLTCILLIACLYPAHRTLRTQSLRALVYGCAFGAIFAVCLSLGAELRVYGGLLPGMGSLVRRAAVPVMITPLLGVFASHAFSCRPAMRDQQAAPIPALAFFLLFALCYAAVLLALYPGVISYDFQHEIRQFTEGAYEAAHPVFHTLFLGALFSLGEALFGSMTAGAALYHSVQLLLLAGMYAWACAFVQSRIRCRAVVIALAVGFALLPFHSVLAVSTAKDPLFAGLCVLLCLFLWEMAEDPSAFLRSRLHRARFALCCLFMALLRHNGIFAYVPAFAAVLVLCRPQRARALVVVCITLALTLLIPKGLETAVGATKTPSTELMSIPCQQLMRTANYAKLTEHEFDQIERWFPGATHTYRANCADPAKGGNFNLGRYQEYPMAFFKTYVKYGLMHPRIYIEAFLLNCVGLWYPDDISHAHSLSNEENEYIYLNTTYPFAEGVYPIEAKSRFPALQKLLYASTHDSVHQNVPFLAQLYCPAVYSFLLLLTTLRLFFTRRRKAALCLLPIWGIFLSLLFSAGIFIRYTYPIMAAVPLLLALAYCTQDAA